jgi:hypothetical protein
MIPAQMILLSMPVIRGHESAHIHEECALQTGCHLIFTSPLGSLQWFAGNCFLILSLVYGPESFEFRKTWQGFYFLSDFSKKNQDWVEELLTPKRNLMAEIWHKYGDISIDIEYLF